MLYTLLMSSREVIKMLTAAGWVLDRVRGDHHIFALEGNPLRAVVPHPSKDLSIGVIKNLERVTGLTLR